MKKGLICTLLLGISIIMTGMTFPNWELQSENEVLKYVDYEVPEQHMELPIKTEYTAETDLVNGDMQIDITIYPANRENVKEVYKDLVGREGKDIVFQGKPAREATTADDHIIVVKNGEYLIEFFTCHGRTAFTGETFGEEDEKVFQDFLKTVKVYDVPICL